MVFIGIEGVYIAGTNGRWVSSVKFIGEDPGREYFAKVPMSHLLRSILFI